MKSNRTLFLALALVAAGAVAGGLRYLAREPAETAAPRPRRPAPPIRFPRIDAALFADATTEPQFTDEQPLGSQLCTQAQFASPAFARWVKELHEEVHYHSKLWEYSFILQALDQRGMLAAGKKGLGFGVGQEPLPSVFAKHGAEVLATDLDLEAATKLGWAQSNQHLTSIDLLNKRGIASEEDFRRLVKVRNVDMNHIPPELTGFDFTWSTCALGHLGNLEKGIAFIENSLKTLKPGGLAVHTTELNLSSNTTTQEDSNTSVYRRRDIEALVAHLTAEGHEVKINFNYGAGPLDAHVDDPPYTSDKHLKFNLNGYALTSLGLVIRKNPAAAP